MDLQKLFNSKIDRRKLMGSAGVMGAGAVLAACSPIRAQPDEDGVTDADVLNFALNLEYLEAEFYLAAIGQAPAYATGGVGTEGSVTGATAVDFDNDLGGALSADFRAAVRAYAEEIAIDEEDHVQFLRGALGDAAVARPAINLGSSFEAAANLAVRGFLGDDSITLDPPFSPYDNALFFLLGAYVFEDVGVTAYKGAAPLIENKDFLSAAAGILGVEAYHAGNIRTNLYPFRDVPSPYGPTVGQIAQAISNLRDTLADPGTDKDQGIVPSLPGNPAYVQAESGVDLSANIVVSDDNGIAFGRTAAEVLAIVYGGADATSGLFFPEGLNGTIK